MTNGKETLGFVVCTKSIVTTFKFIILYIRLMYLFIYYYNLL